MITCCYQCPCRRTGCHGDCPEYRQQRQAHLAQLEAQRREREGNQADDFLIEQARKAKRRRER